MSNVYVLKIDSLSHVFTTLECGAKCQFQYKLINNDNVSDVIQSLAINDVLLCVIDGVIKDALRIVNKAYNSVTLEKEFELKNVYEITNEQILSRLNERQICLVDETFKQDLYIALKEAFNSLLQQLLEINEENEEIKHSENHLPLISPNFIPTQIIYYGVPGSGKSFEIDSKINSKVKSKKEREWRVSRVVFHPDYTNSDFVGQILPVVIPGERIMFISRKV